MLELRFLKNNRIRFFGDPFFLSLSWRAEICLKTGHSGGQVTGDIRQFPKSGPTNPREQMLSSVLQFPQSPKNTSDHNGN